MNENNNDPTIDKHRAQVIVNKQLRFLIRLDLEAFNDNCARRGVPTNFIPAKQSYIDIYKKVRVKW